MKKKHSHTQTVQKPKTENPAK